MSDLHERLHELRVVKPTDYKGYGGEVERWSDRELDYPDCGCGCKYASPLRGKLGLDWVLCTNEKSERFGLLTFEHQAGFGCFTPRRGK